MLVVGSHLCCISSFHDLSHVSHLSQRLEMRILILLYSPFATLKSLNVYLVCSVLDERSRCV